MIIANINGEEGDIDEAALREFLDEGLLKIFNMQKSDLYHSAPTDIILEEAYRLSRWVEEELMDDTAFHELYEVLKHRVGSYYSASLGMMMMYGILASKENVRFRNMKLLEKIENKYKLRPSMQNVKRLAHQVRCDRKHNNKKNNKMSDNNILDGLRGLFEGGHFPNAQINILPGDGVQVSYEAFKNQKGETNEEMPKKVATKEMMSRAAKTTQEAGYWKSQRSWSVVYVVYGIWGYQGSVSDFLDEVPGWPDDVDKSTTCNRDAVEKLKNKYNFTKHIEEWRDNGVPEQYCILGEQLESELVKLLAEQEDTLHNRFDSCV